MQRADVEDARGSGEVTATVSSSPSPSSPPGAAPRAHPWDRARALAPSVLPPIAILAVQQVLFPVPAGILLRGVLVGGLTALVALGMALIHRSNRILNFAQADLGGVPAVLVLMLMTAWGWSYAVAVPVGLVAAVAVGALVELVIIRRFRRAPRLILTVATIGLAQLLAAAAILLPRLWNDERLLAPRVEAPFDAEFTVTGIVFGGNDIIAMVVVPLCIVTLAWFLQRTQLGVAIRASATSSQRAELLGVPVLRLQTTVWAVAGLLAFVATFLRAGILGLPVGSALSFGILLRSLAALLIGRMTNLSVVATSAIALGVLELGVAWNASSPLLIDPILAVVIGIALVTQRRSEGRGDGEGSSWKAAEEVRPIPAVLARVREVRIGRAAFGVGLAAVALVLPHLLEVEDSLKVSAVVIYAILALSLVVLTGWTGQVSLGQVAFFAIGAVVGAKASTDYDADLLVALPLAAAAGAVAAVLVGLPALRRSGLYLAVTTFAFALATTSYLLNRRFFDWVPDQRVPRNPLLGRISLDSPTRIYYVALAGFVVAVVAVRGIRRTRTGRVLIAIRENERAVEAYGVSPTRAKLVAFALSGGLAAFAGCLFVQHQQAFGTGPYEPGQNFAVFTMAVIGGIASIPGAILGAFYLKGSEWLLPADWQFVASGVGVLIVLLVLPTGLGGLVFRLRDTWLRSVVRRRDLVVPSLVGDERDSGPGAPPPPITGPRAEPGPGSADDGGARLDEPRDPQAAAAPGPVADRVPSGTGGQS